MSPTDYSSHQTPQEAKARQFLGAPDDIRKHTLFGMTEEAKFSLACTIGNFDVLSGPESEILLDLMSGLSEENKKVVSGQLSPGAQISVTDELERRCVQEIREIIIAGLNGDNVGRLYTLLKIITYPTRNSILETLSEVEVSILDSESERRRREAEERESERGQEENKSGADSPDSGEITQEWDPFPDDPTPIGDMVRLVFEPIEETPIKDV